VLVDGFDKLLYNKNIFLDDFYKLAATHGVINQLYTPEISFECAKKV